MEDGEKINTFPAKIRKWGDSFAITIDKNIIDTLDLGLGFVLEVRILNVDRTVSKDKGNKK